MSLAEDIFLKRELIMFMGVENHSTLYNPLLFNELWKIPKEVPLKDILIIPILGLGEPYRLLNDQVSFCGKHLWFLFVNSSFLLHNVILFESFPQTDDNNFFNKKEITFLEKSNCRCVTVCDMGVYKSRSLVNMLNSAISSLGTHNISICLATILGYNSRGYTDIETGSENTTYQKDYYLQSNIEVAVQNDNFHFVQIDKKFSLSNLYSLCCLTKNPAETTRQQIKDKAAGYEISLKPLVDSGALELILTSFNKGDSFDFKLFNEYLSKIGFKGDLIDSQWNSIFEKICNKIKSSNYIDRRFHVQELIKAINNNINLTISLVKSI